MAANEIQCVIPYVQGWQVSANGGLNCGLIRFKPSWQKQVSAPILDKTAKKMKGIQNDHVFLVHKISY